MPPFFGGQALARKPYGNLLNNLKKLQIKFILFFWSPNSYTHSLHPKCTRKTQHAIATNTASCTLIKGKENKSLPISPQQMAFSMGVMAMTFPNLRNPRDPTGWGRRTRLIQEGHLRCRTCPRRKRRRPKNIDLLWSDPNAGPQVMIDVLYGGSGV